MESEKGKSIVQLRFFISFKQMEAFTTVAVCFGVLSLKKLKIAL